MAPHSTSILEISNPYKSDSRYKDFRLAQQTWLQLAITLFHELTAGSSLGMLVASAQLAQQSPVNTVFLYALIFDGDMVLLMPKRTTAFADREVWTVPHQGLTVFPGESGSQTSVRTALSHFLHDALDVHCDTDSAYLMKAILPMLSGPIVAVVVRIEIDNYSHLNAEGLQEGGWITRQQLAQLKEQDVYPADMKHIVDEAFAQREFEADVVEQ